MKNMRRLGLILLSFGYAVLLFEALRTADAWWHGEIESPGLVELLEVAALPVLAWIWWRYFSFRRCTGAQCALSDKDGDGVAQQPGPERERRRAAPPGSQ